MSKKKYFKDLKESIIDRMEAYQWQVKTANKIIKDNQEWKDHSMKEVEKCKKNLKKVNDILNNN